MNLFIYTAAADKTQAAVTSLTDITPVESVEQLVLGDSAPLTIKFTDGSSAPSWAGGAGYSLSVGLGTPTVDGLLDYAFTSSFSAITGGWSGRLDLDTQSLINAMTCATGSAVNFSRFPPGVRFPYPASNIGWFYLQVKVTDPDGNAVTYASLRVAVLNRVLQSPVGLDSQYPDPLVYQQTLTDGSTITWDAGLGAAAKVVIAGDRFIQNPTNVVNGLVYILEIINDGAGNRVPSWDSNFVWQGGTVPTPSADSDAHDIYTFFCTGGKLLGSMVGNFAP